MKLIFKNNLKFVVVVVVQYNIQLYTGGMYVNATQSSFLKGEFHIAELQLST